MSSFKTLLLQYYCRCDCSCFCELTFNIPCKVCFTLYNFNYAIVSFENHLMIFANILVNGNSSRSSHTHTQLYLNISTFSILHLHVITSFAVLRKRLDLIKFMTSLLKTHLYCIMIPQNDSIRTIFASHCKIFESFYSITVLPAVISV